jgi:hypothetical protein
MGQSPRRLSSPLVSAARRYSGAPRPAAVGSSWDPSPHRLAGGNPTSTPDPSRLIIHRQCSLRTRNLLRCFSTLAQHGADVRRQRGRGQLRDCGPFQPRIRGGGGEINSRAGDAAFDVGQAPRRHLGLDCLRQLRSDRPTVLDGSTLAAQANSLLRVPPYRIYRAARRTHLCQLRRDVPALLDPRPLVVHGIPLLVVLREGTRRQRRTPPD